MSGSGVESALREVLAGLLPGRELLAARTLGRGHIHGTYLAECRASGGADERYVLQRVNAGVFGDVEALAHNLECVTRHLMAAQRARGVPDPERRALALVVSPLGRTLHCDADGGWWRAFPHIARSRSADTARTRGEAERLARSFGAFVADLADLAPHELSPVLPGFHDLAARQRALEAAVRADPRGRAGELEGELGRARSLGERLAGAPELAAGALPLRVVHNDCKLDNLLVDERSGEPLCVVDLDSVMPGSVLFDFGELVRTGAATAPEDEPDPARMGFDPELYAGLAEGFVRGARGLLRAEEIEALWLAGPAMALENAVRFLTDHLQGDRYFPARRPGHNRDRARAQLALAERMLACEVELRAPLSALDLGR